MNRVIYRLLRNICLEKSGRKPVSMHATFLKERDGKLSEGDTTLWPLHPLQGPYRSRLQLYLRDGHPQFTSLLLQLVLSVNAAASGSARTKGDEGPLLNELSGRVADQFRDMVDSQRRRIREGVELIRREEHLEAIVNVVEVRTAAA